MTPEQLKASILQYAIQGKLVEQRAEEGTGEELYQQIQAEKQRLIQEKKIKKEKPLAEISEDEIPFDIPENWKWCRLSSLTYNWGQKTPDKTFCYIDVGSINNVSHTLNIENTVVEAKDASSRAKKIVQKGDVIFATIRPYLKNICIIDRNFPYEPIVSTAFAVMHCPKGLLNKYLYYYLLSPTFMRFANASDKSKGVAYPAIGEKDFFNGLIALPPLAEQKRIVAKIEELLPLVDRYAVAYEKLEQFNAKFPEDMKKSILQYAIQGKLVEQRIEEGTGEELYQQIQVYKKNLIKDGRLKKTRALEPISEAAIPFDFPQPWKVCYIDDIAFVTKLAGFEYTKYIADNLVADGIPLFKGKNVQNGKLVLSFESYIPKSISDELPRSQIAKKCLLTPYVGTIGNIAIFDGSFKAHLGSNVGKIELLNSDIQTFVLEEYVLWYLKSTYGYAELTKHKKATAQESISIDAIRNVIIAIPPLEEQYRIVAKIEELLPLCDRLRK